MIREYDISFVKKKKKLFLSEVARDTFKTKE